MPIRSVGGGCFKWGGHGKRYCGPGARKKAGRQAAAAHAAGFHEGKMPSFKEFCKHLDEATTLVESQSEMYSHMDKALLHDKLHVAARNKGDTTGAEHHKKMSDHHINQFSKHMLDWENANPDQEI